MNRKEHILEVARELFNTTNTQATTTNHIAKEMGISIGNLHYHYKNREEIVYKLYKMMREEMTLAVEELPSTIKELNEHQKKLIEVQWKYRFFFKELLFLFSRDEKLQAEYIEDNLAHKGRIKIIIEKFIDSGELIVKDESSLEYIVNSILMSWQFYNSYLQTLGENLNSKYTHEQIEHTNNIMNAFREKKN